MTSPSITRLQSLAEASEAAEVSFRREAEVRIAALTKERTYAYRRLNFLKSLLARAAAVTEATEREASVLAFACEQSGWDESKAAIAEVRQALSPVVTAVCAEAEKEIETTLSDTMVSFESWYQGRFNAAFLDLLEQPVRDFTPLTDF